jgi:predicted DNA-binding transcriptional regulator AlpA
MYNQAIAMTVAEFCDKYLIDRSSYYRNAKLGRMPAAIKVGGSTRILLEDEQAWLAKQRGTSAQEVAR